MEHTGFPSEETLAAFIDGRLDEETRKRVVEHLADCAECRETWLGGQQLNRDEFILASMTRHPTSGTKHVRWFSGVAAAAAVAGITIVGAMLRPIYFFSAMGRQRGYYALIRASNALPYRRFESRLADSAVYRELEARTRGDEDHHKTDLLEIETIANQLEKRALSTPDGTTLRNYGAAALLLGDYKDSREALEGALRKETSLVDIVSAVRACRDIDLLNALSSFYSASAETRPTDALLAVETAETAWTVKRTPTTAWNRAIALEGIHVPEATAAWIDSLNLDPESAWSHEAMRRLRCHRTVSPRWVELRRELDDALSRGDEALALTITRQYPREVRLQAEDELLTNWAQSVGNDSAAAKTLSEIVLIGNVLERVNGESLVADTAARIASGDVRYRSAVARALLLNHTANALHVAENASTAEATFSEASDSFRTVNIPLRFRSDVLRATALSYLGRSNDALVLLGSVEKELRASASSDRYPSVVAQLFWSRGFIRVSAGHPIEAVADYERSASIFDRLGETEYAAFVHLLAAQSRELMGQTNAAWDEYSRSAAAIQDRPEFRRAPLMFGHIARSCLANGYLAAADAFESGALKYGQYADTPFLVDAFLARARSNVVAGDLLSARAAIDNALDRTRFIADDVVRQRSVNDIRAAAIEAGLVKSTEAESTLDRAIGDALRNHDELRLSRLYFLRADMRSRASTEGALDDYAAAIAALQEGQAGLRGAAETLEWNHAMRGRLDHAIEYAMRVQRPAVALAWTETARRLVTAPSPTVSGSVTAASALKSDETALVYWSTENSLYVWQLSSDGVQSHRVPVGRAELRRLVGQISNFLSLNDETNALPALARADELLFGPVKGAIARADRLLIIPDESLGGIPYGALFDSGSRHYAVERFQITVFPSLTAAMSHESSQHAALNSALVIADPSFDVELLPHLRRVRFAMADVDIVRRHFPSASVIRDLDATSSAVTTAAQHAAVIHFAGHSISDSEHSGLSALVLTPDSGRDESGLLYARDIERLNMKEVQLLVLASCTSVSGATSPDGFAAIARAFMSAGVHNIVGTLWDIRDGSGSACLSAFYDALSRNAEPAVALREAQLSLIRRSHDLSWTAFEIIGGAAPEKE